MHEEAASISRISCSSRPLSNLPLSLFPISVISVNQRSGFAFRSRRFRAMTAISAIPYPLRDIPPYRRSSQIGVGSSSITRSDRRPFFSAQSRHALHPQAGLVSFHPFLRVHSVHVRCRLPFHWSYPALESAIVFVHQR